MFLSLSLTLTFTLWHEFPFFSFCLLFLQSADSLCLLLGHFLSSPASLNPSPKRLNVSPLSFSPFFLPLFTLP